MAAPSKQVYNASLPAEYAVAVTPSNTVNFSNLTRGIYVGVSGDVAVVMNDDAVIVFKNMNAGSILPIRAKRVNLTNTTATDIVALF